MGILIKLLIIVIKILRAATEKDGSVHKGERKDGLSESTVQLNII